MSRSRKQRKERTESLYEHALICYLPNKDAEGREFDEGVLIESTRLIESFVREAEFTQEALTRVGAFMKRFKKATRQETVAMVVDGEMYYL